MIEYEEDWLVKLLFKRDGSVAVNAAAYGLFSATLAVLLLVAMEWDTSQTLANLVKEVSKSQLWSASTVVIALLLGFRTKIAYSRFWEGTSLLHQMRGEWFDTASNLITFTIAAKSTKPVEVTKFRQTLVRLMSLCHATALEEIAGSSVKLEAIDTFGLDTKTLKHLTECAHTYKFNQVEIMLHIIQTLITAAHEDGVIKIPPPILSRVYQTLSRGFVNVLNAKKICDTRFPFPYAQMIAILLFFSALLMPLQIVAVVEAKSLAAIFTFVPVWGFVALNMVANQLEDPFGTDSNDLPLEPWPEVLRLQGIVSPWHQQLDGVSHQPRAFSISPRRCRCMVWSLLEHFQTEMNGSLLMLLHPDSDHIPTVKDACTSEFKELLDSVYTSEGKVAPTGPRAAPYLSRRLSSFDSMRVSDRKADDVEDLCVDKVLPERVPETHVQLHAAGSLGERSGHELPEIEPMKHGCTDAFTPLARENSPSVPPSHVGQFAQGKLVSFSSDELGTDDPLATTWETHASTTAVPPPWASQLTANTTSRFSVHSTAASPTWTPQVDDAASCSQVHI